LGRKKARTWDGLLVDKLRLWRKKKKRKASDGRIHGGQKGLA